MTTRTKIFLLRPLGPRASPILSHTLFGSTCWALVALGHDVGRLLRDFQDGPRFAFSGGYPYTYTKEDEPLLLLPSPSLRVPAVTVNAAGGDIEERVDRAKVLRKARFISQGVGGRLRSGAWDVSDLFAAVLQKQVQLHNGALWLASEIKQVWGKWRAPQPLWQQTVTQRNSVDRVAGATGQGLLFQNSETFYDLKRAGIWFALQADETLWSDLEGALRFVFDTGLGSNRSVGKGHFAHERTLSWQSVFPASVEAEHFLSLSHYIPSAPEESVPCSYGLDVIRQKTEKRYPQGDERIYIATVRVFQAGGIFKSKGKRRTFYGRLLPLGEVGDRTVYYDGMALPLWGAWEV